MTNLPVYKRSPLPIDDLRTELAALEDDCTNLTDEELQERIRIVHTGFSYNVPLFHPGATIFRAVRVSAKPFYKARLSYPPVDRIHVNGRLNRAGEAMFYGALGKTATISCLRECRCAAGENFAVSVWRTTKPLALMHFGHTRKAIAEKAQRDLPEWAIEDDTPRNTLIREWQSRVFTRSIPDGEEHLYRLSIALRDFALSPLADGDDPNMPKFMAGVTYPTVSMWLLGDNVALHPSVADSSLSLEQVMYLTVTSIAESTGKEGGKDWNYCIRLDDFARSFRNNGWLVWKGESTALSVSPCHIANATSDNITSSMLYYPLPQERRDSLF